jgi:hypothetical protein
MKFFIGTVVIIFLILIGTVLLLSRRGGNSSPQGSTGKPVPVVITDYAGSSSEVSITTDGRIVDEDRHRAIRVTVSPTVRKIEIIQGYSGKVIDSRVYSNDKAAYEAFMYALKTANYTRELAKPKVTDDKGACPTGRRYYYELRDNAELIKRLWSTSCGDVGTFAGNGTLIRSLFKQQIPDYGKITAKVSL